MREIKFRHYFPSTGVVTAGHDVMTIILTSTGKEDFWKDAVWMQYTGLKDKNGKEIYEGDIILYDLAEGLGQPATKGHKREVKVTPYGAIGQWDKNIRVIGNIYQNTELLKK